MARNEVRFSDEPRQLLSFHYVAEEAIQRTHLALRSPRKMNFLGRFVRLEFMNLQEEVSAMDLSDEELQMLLSISNNDGSEPTNPFDLEPSSLTMLLNGLESKGLVLEADGATRLTSRGRLALQCHQDAISA
jgi:DNA-binding MarR family transcriptional regulator